MTAAGTAEKKTRIPDEATRPSSSRVRSQDDLDEARATIFHCTSELAREIFDRGCPTRLYAHSGSELNPIELRVVQIKHRKSLRPGIAGSDTREFNIEDGVGSKSMSKDKR